MEEKKEKEKDVGSVLSSSRDSAPNWGLVWAQDHGAESVYVSQVIKCRQSRQSLCLSLYTIEQLLFEMLW